MNFWKIICLRWSGEELKKWTSMRKTAYLLLPLLFYFAVHDISQVLLWALVEFSMRRGGEGAAAFVAANSNTLQGIINGLAILIGLAVIWTAVKQEIWPEETAAGEKKQKEKKSFLQADQVTAYAFLAVLSFCTAMGLNILFYQMGFTASSQSFGRIHEMQYGVDFLIGIFLYGVVSPFAEEAVFRGLIYNRMKRCFGFVIGLVFSSLLFGCYHGNLVQAVYGFILGLLMAYVYDLYKSFAAPVLFHGIANVSVYTITYRNSLEIMDKKAAVFIGILLLLAAVGIFVYILKKLASGTKKGF